MFAKVPRLTKSSRSRQAAKYDRLGANWKHGDQFEPPPGFSGFDGQFRQGPGGFNFQGGGGGGGFSTFSKCFLASLAAGVALKKCSAARWRPSLTKTPAPRQATEQTHEIGVSLTEAYNGATRQLSLQGPAGTQNIDVKIPKGATTGNKRAQRAQPAAEDQCRKRSTF